MDRPLTRAHYTTDEKGRNPQHWWTGEVVFSLLVTFFRFWASSVTSDDMPLDVRIDPFSLSLCSFPKKQARFRWRVEFRTARRCEKEISFSLLTGIQPDSGLNAIVTTMFLVRFLLGCFLSVCFSLLPASSGRSRNASITTAAASALGDAPSRCARSPVRLVNPPPPHPRPQLTRRGVTRRTTVTEVQRPPCTSLRHVGAAGGPTG